MSRHFVSRGFFLPMRTILLVFPAIVVFAFGCASTPPARLLPEVELHGHRGARGLAPENSWVAFERALAEGMNVMELDTVVTKDLRLVVHHDTEVNPELCRYEDGSRPQKQPIRQVTLEELKKLDCGSDKNPKFPEQKLSPGEKLISLDEFFVKFREVEKKNPAFKQVLFNIETKFPGGTEASPRELEEFATLMVAAIEKAGMAERATVQSFAIEVLPLVKQKNSKIRTSALFAPTKWQGLRMYLGLGGGLRKDILAKAAAVKADVISPYWLYCNADFIARAHAQHMPVIPWTVNDEKKMRELLNNGIDGIITDYPDRLAKVMRER